MAFPPEFDSQLLRRSVATADLLKGRLARAHDYAGLRVDEVLRLADDRVVYRVRHAGARAILKLYLAPDAATIVRRVQAEFELMAETMAEGPLQVARCLAAEPEHGFVLLSFAPGRPASDEIGAAGAAKRRRLMRQAGEWLAKYTALRRREQTFVPRQRLQSCIEASARQLDSGDRALLERLSDTLARRREAHSGRPVIHAATHGDFAPFNINFHRGVMTGFDIRGEFWSPVARDAAQFLGWSAIRCPPPDGPRALGIPRADLDAFLEGGAIAPGEAETTLAFFLGARLHRFLARPDRKPEDLHQARAAAGAYLAAPIAG